jgi:hypothetical protein
VAAGKPRSTSQQSLARSHNTASGDQKKSIERRLPESSLDAFAGAAARTIWLLWRIYLLTAMDTVHKLCVYDAMAFNAAK